MIQVRLGESGTYTPFTDAGYDIATKADWCGPRTYSIEESAAPSTWVSIALITGTTDIAGATYTITAASVEANQSVQAYTVTIKWTADLYPAIPAGTRTATVDVIAACMVASLTPSKATDAATYTVLVSGDTAASTVIAPTYRQIDTLAVKDCAYPITYTFEVGGVADDLSTYAAWLSWNLGTTTFSLKTTNPDTATATDTLAVTLVPDVTTTNKDVLYAVNKGYVLTANLRREQCATHTFNTPSNLAASIAVEDMRDSESTFTDPGDTLGLCGTRAFTIINVDDPTGTWVTVAQVGVTSDYKITASPRLKNANTYNMKLKIASVEYLTNEDETNTFTVVVTKCGLASVVQSSPTGNVLEYTIPSSGPLTAATPLVITPWTQTSVVAAQFCVYAEDFSYVFNNVAYTVLTDVSWLNVKSDDAGTLEAYPTDSSVASEKLTVTVSTILQDAASTPGSNTFEVLAFLKRADCGGQTMQDIATLPQSPATVVTLVHKDYVISTIQFTDPGDTSSAKCGDRSFKLVNSEADQVSTVPSWVKMTHDAGTYTITVITMDVSVTEVKEFSLRIKSDFYDSVSAPTIADRFYIFKVDIDGNAQCDPDVFTMPTVPPSGTLTMVYDSGAPVSTLVINDWT